MHRFLRLTLALLCPLTVLAATQKVSTGILLPQNASWAEKLAASEVRRYVYCRSGTLLPIRYEGEAKRTENALILIGRKDRTLISQAGSAVQEMHALAPQAYCLKTLDENTTSNAGRLLQNRQLALLVGGDDFGTLYAAYRFAEILGIRFYLHDDIIPDKQIRFQLPMLSERAEPIFAVRGIQPFHDFPEGPDWWNREDYLAVIGQLPKLRMNFFGLHTYPEDRPNAEPTVWIGPPSELAERSGRVRASYPSSYQNTLRGNWGYVAKETSKFSFGAATLFERDDFGPEMMWGHIPAPKTAEACNEVFDRAGELLRDAFRFAQQVGVKTCVGTETPLIIPKQVQERLKAAGKNPADPATLRELYKGIFRRAAEAYPLDYYWFWTPENWTWSGTKDEEVRATTNDLFAAVAAHQDVKPPFGLATCGWVLGPQQDRAMFDKVLPRNVALSCINREVGKTPVEPGFAEVAGRSKWAIPWMEDDPALTSPQLWVGRMRRDAVDARRYGCDGLLGIHWRTRVLAPNVAALAQAAWRQDPWAASYTPPAPPDKTVRVPGPVGGNFAAFPNQAIEGTPDPTLYQTVRYNVTAYHLPATNGPCRVLLQFCEPHYSESGKRVFDVKLQGSTVITNLDVFARVGRNKALDFTFENVPITNGWLSIEFMPHTEFPSIAALDVQGEGFRTRINCGGPAHGDYAADAPAAEPSQQVYAETADFYKDWAFHEFGKEIADEAAAIFVEVDCKLPVPSVWTDGPGGIQPDTRPWAEVKKQYDFVERFVALRSRVNSAGELERFDYWRSTLEYFRNIGELNCAWGEFNRALEKAKAEKDPTARTRAAKELALPARIKVVQLTASLYAHLLGTVTTPGELGTVANWDQHNLPVLLTKSGEALEQLIGEALPSEAHPRQEYQGPLRIIVPSKRTALEAGEPLKLKVIILSEQPPRKAELLYRKLGTGPYAKTPLRHVARGVYRVEVPWAGKEDLEYYISVQPAAGKPVVFPASAPKINRTVVMYGKELK